MDLALFILFEGQTIASWVVTTQNGDIEIDRAKLRSAVSDWPAKQGKERGDDKTLPPSRREFNPFEESVVI